jgi:hypothetical protein
LGLDLQLFETLDKDNGTPKNVEQLAVPRNAEPLLVCEFTSIDPDARRTVSL